MFVSQNAAQLNIANLAIILDGLSTTLPIFIIIGIGFGAVRLGLFLRADTWALSGSVTNFALPALVLRALSQRPLAEIVNANYLLACTLGSLSDFLPMFSVAHIVQGRSGSVGAILSFGTISGRLLML